MNANSMQRFIGADGSIDLLAVEIHARHLRAEATAQLLRQAGSGIARLFHRMMHHEGPTHGATAH